MLLQWYATEQARCSWLFCLDQSHDNTGLAYQLGFEQKLEVQLLLLAL